ncbi:MAG: rhomboid family intramembrane serine protease [Thermoanaerobaculia bacterium]
MIPLRNSGRSRRFPWATISLVVANVALFSWELSLGAAAEHRIAALAVAPAEVVAFADPLRLPFRLVAALFLHGGWLHLLGNMAFLGVFGDDVEGRLGGRRFLFLYLGSGLVASAAQIAVTPASSVPLIGASGAIAGVLGSFLVLFPKARLEGILPLGCLVVPMRSRAFLFLPVWFLLQLWGALAAAPGSATGGVAWYAHLAGFAAGPVLLHMLRRRR